MTSASGFQCFMVAAAVPDIWHRMEPCALPIACVLIAAMFVPVALMIERDARKDSEAKEHTARVRDRLRFDERMRAHELRERWLRAKYGGLAGDPPDSDKDDGM